MTHDKEMPGLLPCPFCGGEALEVLDWMVLEMKHAALMTNPDHQYPTVKAKYDLDISQIEKASAIIRQALLGQTQERDDEAF